MKVYHGSYTEIDVIDLSLCETFIEMEIAKSKILNLKSNKR